MTEPGAKTGSRLQHLDGLRGLAIAVVVLYHAFTRWNGIEPWEPAPFAWPLYAGKFGVQLFFVISGFVIFMSLERSAGALGFARRRWLRLFPAMLIAAIFIWITAPLIPARPLGAPNWVDFLPSLSFISPAIWSAALGTEVRWLDGVFWTLWVEAVFYAVAAIAFFGLKDRAGLLVMAIAAGELLVAIPVDGLGMGWKPLALANFAGEKFGAMHFFWFACGICIWRYIAGGQADRRLLAGAAACALLAGLRVALDEGAALGLLLGPVVLALVFGACFTEPGRRLAASSVPVFFGFISYPLYLVHQNLVTGMGIELHGLLPGLPGWAYPLLPMTVAVLVAWAIAKAEPGLRRAIDGALFRPFRAAS